MPTGTNSATLSSTEIVGRAKRKLKNELMNGQISVERASQLVSQMQAVERVDAQRRLPQAQAGIQGAAGYGQTGGPEAGEYTPDWQGPLTPLPGALSPRPAAAQALGQRGPAPAMGDISADGTEQAPALTGQRRATQTDTVPPALQNPGLQQAAARQDGYSHTQREGTVIEPRQRFSGSGVGRAGVTGVAPGAGASPFARADAHERAVMDEFRQAGLNAPDQVAANTAAADRVRLNLDAAPRMTVDELLNKESLTQAEKEQAYRLAQQIKESDPAVAQAWASVQGNDPEFFHLEDLTLEQQGKVYAILGLYQKMGTLTSTYLALDNRLGNPIRGHALEAASIIPMQAEKTLYDLTNYDYKEAERRLQDVKEREKAYTLAIYEGETFTPEMLEDYQTLADQRLALEEELDHLKQQVPISQEGWGYQMYQRAQDMLRQGDAGLTPEEKAVRDFAISYAEGAGYGAATPVFSWAREGAQNLARLAEGQDPLPTTPESVADQILQAQLENRLALGLGGPKLSMSPGNPSLPAAQGQAVNGSPALLPGAAATNPAGPGSSVPAWPGPVNYWQQESLGLDNRDALQRALEDTWDDLYGPNGNEGYYNHWQNHDWGGNLPDSAGSNPLPTIGEGGMQRGYEQLVPQTATAGGQERRVLEYGGPTGQATEPGALLPEYDGPVMMTEPDGTGPGGGRGIILGPGSALEESQILESGESIDGLEHEGYTESPVPIDIPDYVRTVAEHIRTHKGSPLQGYKGGKTYLNTPKFGSQELPTGVHYKEYDVHPFVKGQKRGVERLVIGDDGSVWYTNDHYNSFQRME